MTRGRRALVAAVVAALAVVVAALATRSLWVPALVRAAAARRGVELSFATARVSGATVALDDVTLSLRGVRGVTARASRVNVFTSGLSISRVDVLGAAARVTELDLDGLRGAARRAGGGAALHVRDLSVTWGGALARGVDVDHAPGRGGKLRATEVALSGAAATGVEVSWTTMGDDTTVSAPGRFDARLRLPERGAGALTVTFPQQSIAALTGARHPQARASGALSLALPDGDGAATGEVTARVDGVAPQVGREAARLVGSRTDVTAALTSRPGGPLLLSPVKLTNGAVALSGRGELSRAGELSLSLDGAIPCAAAAASAAGGGLIGGLVGRAVGAALGGNVTIHLAIHADAANPGDARVTPTVRAACGL